MTDIGREYGEGLFLLCQEEGLIQRVEDELKQVLKLFSDNPEYDSLLSARMVPKSERLALCDQAFRGQVHEYVLNFLKILIERGALHELGACSEHFHQRLIEVMGLVEATVLTAKPLTPAQTSALQKKLSDLSGKKAVLSVTVDPSLVGGLRVDMQGMRYDNTIQHRLDLMRRRLTDEM